MMATQMVGWLVMNAHLPTGGMDHEYAAACEDMVESVREMRSGHPSPLIMGVDANIEVAHCSSRGELARISRAACPRGGTLAASLMEMDAPLHSAARDLGTTRRDWSQEDERAGTTIFYVGGAAGAEALACSKPMFLKDVTKSDHDPLMITLRRR